MALENTYSELKDKLNQNLRFKPDSTTQASSNLSQEKRNLTESVTSEYKEETIEKIQNVKTAEQVDSKPAKKFNFSSTINDSVPVLGKVIGFVKDSWEQTFPKENYDRKIDINKKSAKKAREAEKNQIYSENEVSQMQESIPDWKRTAVTNFVEDTE